MANNVLAHVDDPADFLAGARQLLADDGMLVFEVPYLGELLDKLEYDTIYHEHLCYFSVTAVMSCARWRGWRWNASPGCRYMAARCERMCGKPEGMGSKCSTWRPMKPRPG